MARRFIHLLMRMDESSNQPTTQPEKKRPMTAAERKRKSRMRKRTSDFKTVTIELDPHTAGILLSEARSAGVPLKNYIEQKLKPAE
ncbi:hypothetical protein JIN82_10080 [Persicirhabdus sediminis]|uniref:Uncharacterized protein n=2 Tax=Persicirhabdus sediminis TaxID=454144 RepID=A0A8J7SLP3_9BACT|nr:hypothetical protein [Persicirhabdus sediminis]